MHDKNDGKYRGEKGRHLSPRVVQKVAEGRNLVRIELESKNDYYNN